jgi:hypothetical protein
VDLQVAQCVVRSPVLQITGLPRASHLSGASIQGLFVEEWAHRRALSSLWQTRDNETHLLGMQICEGLLGAQKDQHSALSQGKVHWRAAIFGDSR